MLPCFCSSYHSKPHMLVGHAAAVLVHSEHVDTSHTFCQVNQPCRTDQTLRCSFSMSFAFYSLHYLSIRGKIRSWILVTRGYSNEPVPQLPGVHALLLGSPPVARHQDRLAPPGYSELSSSYFQLLNHPKSSLYENHSLNSVYSYWSPTKEL